MEQAYLNFNSGKYKQALNALSQSNLNIDSYEPNLAVCEYLTNRCTQSTFNCLRKLNDLISKKIKREAYRMDSQTENMIKLNIAVLLILSGKRDNALLVLQDIYENKECFIEFMQSRIFLLLMEINVNLKNSFQVLRTYRNYMLKPVEQRQLPTQWISIIMHEHNKAHNVSREQFVFMTKVLLNQALIQLGVSPSFLSSNEEDEKMRDQLVQRVKKRKTISKYYQINVIMIGRFFQAQKELHSKNYSKCLSMMNFVNIVDQFEQMPSTKIISNILNAFATSNTGLVHFAYEKPIVSLYYFIKAKGLLSKACTGVEDKDLQLFSINYANHNDSITYNIALALLASKPKESYATFQSIRKANQNSKNYKYWYRIGQSTLEQYHISKLTPEQKRFTLLSALTSFSNCLICIENSTLPKQNELKKILPMISQDEIQSLIMKINHQTTQFRHSSLVLTCYVSLCLQMFHKVIKIGQNILQEKKLSPENRINITHYVLEAYIRTNRNSSDLTYYLTQLEKETAPCKDSACKTLYATNSACAVQEVDYEYLLRHQIMVLFIRDGRIPQAAAACQNMRQKQPAKLLQSLKTAIKYMHLKIGFDKKFAYPYLRLPDHR